LRGDGEGVGGAGAKIEEVEARGRVLGLGRGFRRDVRRGLDDGRGVLLLERAEEPRADGSSRVGIFMPLIQASETDARTGRGSASTASDDTAAGHE
jgi:hypothetical protein